MFIMTNLGHLEIQKTVMDLSVLHHLPGKRPELVWLLGPFT